jgi:hypothetical protein
MEILKKYVVYELNPTIRSEEREELLALKKVDFDGYVINSFDSELQAIQALIDDKKSYEGYVILRQVFLRS